MSAWPEHAGEIAWHEIIDAPVDHRTVTVCSAQAQAGRSTTLLGLGTALALHRRDQVVALDAVPQPEDRPGADVASRLGVEHPRTARDLLDAIAHVHTSSGLRGYTSVARSRLEALAGVVEPDRLSPSDVAVLHEALTTFRQVLLVDTAPSLDVQLMRSLALVTDGLVIPVRLRHGVDPVAVVANTLDWWTGNVGKGWLLGLRAVVAVIRPPVLDPELQRLEAEFLSKVCPRVRVVVPIPEDPALDHGVPFVWGALQEPTRAAFTHLALEVARGFTRMDPA